MKSKTVLIRSEAEKEKMLKKMRRTCTKCDCVKPPRAHHCSICGKCVLAMDHHCPWMNNCIGLYNMKAFLLFNFYTMLTGTYSMVRAIVAIVLCFTHDRTCLTYNNAAKLGVGIAIVCLVALFVLFTGAMFIDQVKMKLENTSTIERLQLSTNKVS